MDKLDPYRAKRDPTKTPEPVPAADGPSDGGRTRHKASPPATRAAVAQKKSAGTPAKAGKRGKAANSFVVQEHHARALHWDFRLERDGVLVSWAVPKGLPPDRGVNHLAVHVEDHPLEYGSFEGTIPKGEYGGGDVTIWDEGTYECDEWTDRSVKVTLHGRRVDARYGLFCTGGKNWMIHRIDPAPAGWTALPDPAALAPMLAVAGALPSAREDDAQAWRYEFKWDGVRALAFCDGGRVRLFSRNGRDVSASYPEIRDLGLALGTTQAVLDGEVVALDEAGRPDFGKLQERMHVSDPARARRLAARVPVAYLLFDLVHLDGRSLVDLPYTDRRRLLEALSLQGPHLATPPSMEGPGATVLDAARAAGLEGVVAKRADAPYRVGRRSGEWVKVKNTTAQEVVIGGWSSGRGNRANTIGSLLLGIPGPDGLEYVGRVGTGFSESTLRDLSARLGRIERRTSPFSAASVVPSVAGTTIHWVRPSLVGEVEYREWTREGRLRHPTWRGLRSDKDASHVVRES